MSLGVRNPPGARLLDMESREMTNAELMDLKHAIEAECARLGVTPKQYLAFIEKLRQEEEGK